MNMKQTWGRLLTYTGKYKSYVIWSFISAMISVASSLIGPYMIGVTIDKMIGKGAVQFADVFRLLTLLGLVYLVGSMFGWLLTYLTNGSLIKRLMIYAVSCSID
ncbi:hypothetical protein RE628_06045 [Paenibacillus sp. D2_2]|nr:hypothetical protein [Paenibacillus sp. D2_2]WMT41999.1 hypothetical protein RE628_06045 [Paenibacillus sp. D2_2]